MTLRALFIFRWFHRLVAAGAIVFALHYGALNAFTKKYADKRALEAQFRLLNAMDIHALTEIKVTEL